MQKELPKRGWQHIVNLLDFTFHTSRCKKNYPKGDGNIWRASGKLRVKRVMQKELPKRGWQLGQLFYYYPLYFYSRCKKNYPKGDGNFFLAIKKTVKMKNDAKRITQKGMATCYNLKDIFIKYDFDAKRITQKGMATPKVLTLGKQVSSLGCKENYPKGDGGNVSILDMNTLKCLAGAKRIT